MPSPVKSTRRGCWRTRGPRAGNVLLLTKSIGTASSRRAEVDRAPGRRGAAVRSMTTLNRGAGEALKDCRRARCTRDRHHRVRVAGPCIRDGDREPVHAGAGRAVGATARRCAGACPRQRPRGRPHHTEAFAAQLEIEARLPRISFSCSTIPRRRADCWPRSIPLNAQPPGGFRRGGGERLGDRSGDGATGHGHHPSGDRSRLIRWSGPATHVWSSEAMWHWRAEQDP